MLNYRLASLILLLCAPVASLLAQLPVAFEEEFDQNGMEWWEGSSAPGSAKLTDGTYVIRGARPRGWWYSSRPIFVDPNADWAIEARLRQVGGATNSGYGLVWSTLNAGNLNEMLVVSEDAVRVATSRGGTFTDRQAWKVTGGAVKGFGQWNTLRVERKGKQMRYLVNGREVATSSLLPAHGLELGVIVTDTVTVQIDRLVVEQKQDLRLVPNAPKKVEKVNLGPNVNSEYEELGPVISPDGRTLFFSVNHHPENSGGVKDADDIWFSTASTDTTWRRRERMGWPLNNEQSNWVISVTPDNNTLLVANLYGPDGVPAGSGLSLSHRSDTGWTLPRQVVLQRFTNHSTWQQFGLSNDRKVLLLSVTGDDTYGDHDLYVSFLQPDGTWSEQRNLGSDVNTIGAEGSPFLAADNKTLYFSTNGRPGFGQTDIYVTRRLDETWLSWSEPENLGPAINTSGNERYFSVTASGQYAYMNSSYNSLGKGDIFRLRLPDALRPFPVVMVYGRVLRSTDRKPLSAGITYRDLSSDIEVGIASSDPRDGGYKIVLPAGRIYSFMAGREGYYAVSDNLDVSKLTGYREIKRDLLLTPVEVGATIRLNNLFFDFAKAELRPESFPELNRAAKFFKANAGVRVEIAGHTDDIGTDADNLRLSEARAKAVVDYLTRKGIDISRLQAVGYGESKPLGPNTNDDGRQQNRRVEFRIVER